MILLNDFFRISDTESSATEIWAELFINADHKIFGCLYDANDKRNCGAGT
jgi:hypothetical protein